MDTSKEYIKMCVSAKYIQKNWNPSVGDVVAFSVYGQKGRSTDIIVKNGVIVTNSHGIFREGYWLPKQDQLQEMSNNWDAPASYNKLIGTVAYITMNTKYYKKFNSMEQLWLAFVMKEKCRKTWNGKEWGEEI